MSDKLRATVSHAFANFVIEHGEPSLENKNVMANLLKFPISELFDSEKNGNKAKNILGKAGFGKAVACYLDTFQAAGAIDFARLSGELVKNRKVFLRHLGRDKLALLSLLAEIANGLPKERKGLLAA